MQMPDNPESYIYRPNYRPSQEQNRQKKLQQKRKIEKSLLQEEEVTNSLLPKLRQILNKNNQLRTPADINFLTKYIEAQNSPFLTHILQLTNMDTARSVLRNCNIHDITKNRYLVKEKQQVTRIIIILQGKFVGVKDQLKQSLKSIKSVKQWTQKQYLQSLVKKSTILMRQLKRKWKAGKDDQKQLIEFKTTKAQVYDLNIIKEYKQEQIFNVSGIQDNQYMQGLVSCAEGKIMTISYKIFLQIMTNYIKTQRNKKLSLFRRFQYFDQLQNQKILTLVDHLPLLKKYKGQYIYKQAEKTQNLFILISGSIKITKTVEMFKQNPNLLYKNRASIKGTNIVEFADFSQVYNYKPKTKTIELGMISDLCIFGEQQIICQVNLREVSIQVMSREINYYQINLKELQSFIPDKKGYIEDLKRLLYEKQTEKKILYRQEKLGQILMTQNQNNMDYFFLDENKPQSPSKNNKFKISRVNNFLGQQSPTKAQESTQKAQYNIFNFTKLQKKRPQNLRKNPSFSLNSLSKDQEKVMQLVHTVGLNPPPIKQPQQLITKISPKKSRIKTNKQNKRHSIDIFNPLFSIAYFEKSHRDNIKIEKQSRMRPLTTTRTSRSARSTIK